MARKRSRRRRATVRRRSVRRRRRGGAKRAAQVVLRRRGVTVYRSNPRRRRYRRNPGVSAGGIVSTLKTGVKEGAIILVAQVAARKGINLVARFNPIQGIAGTAINGLATAIVGTLAVRKVAPNYARLASAGMFAEALRGILSSVPAVAPLLAGYDDGLGDGELEAWPAVRPANMGAYPGAMGGEDDNIPLGAYA